MESKMIATHTSMRLVAAKAATLVLGVAALLVVSCSAGTKEPGDRVEAAATQGPQTHTIIIRELKFQPAVLTAHVGDTVEWKNEDVFPHNAVSTEPKKFDSATIPVGSSWKYQTTRKGDYFYQCTLHPNMRAKLVVQ